MVDIILVHLVWFDSAGRLVARVMVAFRSGIVLFAAGIMLIFATGAFDGLITLLAAGTDRALL